MITREGDAKNKEWSFIEFECELTGVRIIKYEQKKFPNQIDCRIFEAEEHDEDMGYHIMFGAFEIIKTLLI